MTSDAISRLVRERVESGAVAAIAAGVFDAIEGAQVATLGEAGKGQRPLGTRSVFEIGSVTKVVTATLLADMARRGEVLLSEAVDGCLPDGVHAPRWHGRGMTLEDLAEHRSGLPRMPTNLDATDLANPFGDYTVEDLYEFLGSYSLARPPGAEYEYSNVGFGLLGHALALRARLSLSDLFDERILRPLELRHTSASIPRSKTRELALPHDEFGRIVARWDPGVMLGCGGLLSTVGDMLAFAAANLDDPDNPLAPAMATAREPRYRRADGMRVGLAWHVRRPIDRDVVWHSGETGGSRAFIGLEPERRRGVVVLSNSATPINDIGLHLLDDRIDLAPLPQDSVLDMPTLAEYVGSYRIGSDMTVAVELSDSGLIGAATGLGRAPLHPRRVDEFVVQPINGSIRFHRDGAGAIVGLTFDYLGRRLSGTKTV